MRARPTRSPSRSGEQVGLGVAGRRDASRCRRQRACASLQPVGRVRQRLVGPELDHRAAHVLVAVADVDVARARARTRRASARVRAARARSRVAMKTVWPGSTFAPTRTASSAYCSSRSSTRQLPYVLPQDRHASRRRVVIPSTATSGPPIMKSVCTAETLMPRSRSSSGVRPSSAVDPERDRRRRRRCGRSRSRRTACRRTSARSGRRATRRRRARPRRGACANSSIAICALDGVFARSRPSPRPRRRLRSASPGRATIVPPSCSGRVERTVPSVRRQSGHVKTSSVGRFGDVVDPVDRLQRRRRIQRAPGSRPTVRSVPGPVKWMRVELERVQLLGSARAGCRVCARQAATGSSSSRRTRVRDRLPERARCRARRRPAAPGPRSDTPRSSS